MTLNFHPKVSILHHLAIVLMLLMVLKMLGWQVVAQLVVVEKLALMAVKVFLEAKLE